MADQSTEWNFKHLRSENHLSSHGHFAQGAALRNGSALHQIGGLTNLLMYYGPEMTARIVCNWLAGVGAKTLYVGPDSSWGSGYCELFSGNLRCE